MNSIQTCELAADKISRPRRAGPQDVDALIAHYQRLSEIDRYTRFFSAMSEDGITRYADATDWSRMVAVCVHSGDDLVGVAELGWDECGNPMSAELGVSVDSKFRRRGVASWLVEELFRLGAKVGVQDVHASWVGGNDAVGRIMREYGAEIWLSSNHWRGRVSLSPRQDAITRENQRATKVVGPNA